MSDLNPKKVLEFMELINVLKHSSRMGWEQRNIEKPETISGHMYAMAMMTMLTDNNTNLDQNKCMQLALVHDLAECIVGDITPQDNVNSEEKHKMEMDAMIRITNLLGEGAGTRILSLYKEYEAKLTPEAKFVKDLDRFDMIFTAYCYEKRDKTPKKLQEFFDSTDGKFEHSFVKKLVEALNIQREAEAEKDTGDLVK